MNTINEILEEANETPAKLMEHDGNAYLRNFMEAAYFPEKKFVLPEGVPPFKQNNQHEQQLRGAFWQLAKKIDVFQRADLKPFRRETLFVQALESLPEVESKLLLAAKDQTLDKIFPKLTLKALQKVGYFK